MSKEITFRKKYPEFKDLISYDKECDTEFVAVGLIESVLDKHFVRLHTTDFIKLKNKAEEDGHDRAMQKVKEALTKFPRNNSELCQEILKELKFK